ncbi:unnamed protein product [Haemonchus placei]|uniref:RNase H domain-containing protein n=1 Tax=Haemonchus placei TaxID=6290 RepID=A0A0N4X1Q9_HAEPC|nr:unnamed protein product [Haemonchus placei]
MAKSKLPSLHGASTMPKLEMNAITPAARLANAIATQLKTTPNIEEIYIFSNSEIALWWVRSPTNREKFVQFGHMPSEQNPTDCGTRGLTSTAFSQHYWWKGPIRLQERRPLGLHDKQSSNATPTTKEKTQGIPPVGGYIR